MTRSPAEATNGSPERDASRRAMDPILQTLGSGREIRGLHVTAL